MLSLRSGVPALLAFALTLPVVALPAQQPDPRPGNPLTTALWFAHRHAAPQALTPGNDRPLKARLIAALAKSPELTWEAAAEFFDEAAFRSLAGGGRAIPLETMERMVRDTPPQSRKDMHPRARLHADLLSTQFDLIEEQHRKPAADLVDWVVRNYRPGKRLGIVAVCTANTRRSVLGATMGNVASGLPMRWSLPSLSASAVTRSRWGSGRPVWPRAAVPICRP